MNGKLYIKNEVFVGRVEAWTVKALRRAKKVSSVIYRWAPAGLYSLEKPGFVLFGIHIFNPHCSIIIISERQKYIKGILAIY